MTGTASPSACAFCGNTEGNRIWRAREMMFGTRDEFDYLECGRCGSLRLVDVPADLGRYYPADYHSFQGEGAPQHVKQFLLRQWADASAGEWTPLGALLRRIRGPREEISWILPTGLDRSARILDVGSGGGAVLRKMQQCGYTDLTGVEPFIPANVSHGRGLRILKGELRDVEGEYDLVTFHHSLEHIADQEAALAKARERLRPGGWVLVRVPLVNEAWRRYRTDWVELDAPRHIALHTPKGFERLARQAGLALESVTWDSTAFELWGSEQYARGVPLFDEASHAVDPGRSAFSRRDMRRFRRAVEQWNEAGLSGRAAFYFRAA